MSADTGDGAAACCGPKGRAATPAPGRAAPSARPAGERG
jgi:hypothetical protein